MNTPHLKAHHIAIEKTIDYTSPQAQNIYIAVIEFILTTQYFFIAYLVRIRVFLAVIEFNFLKKIQK